MNLRVFCIRSLSHRFSFQSCTQDFPVALTLTMTHWVIVTRAIVPCARAQTGVSASSLIFVFWSRLRDGVEVFGTLLAASHPRGYPDSSRGVIVRNTSHCLHVQKTTWTRLLVARQADCGGQRWCTCIEEWTSSGYRRIRDKRGNSSNAVAHALVFSSFCVFLSSFVFLFYVCCFLIVFFCYFPVVFFSLFFLFSVFLFFSLSFFPYFPCFVLFCFQMVLFAHFFF